MDKMEAEEAATQNTSAVSSTKNKSGGIGMTDNEVTEL
jgi:hypothetical protein